MFSIAMNIHIEFPYLLNHEKLLLMISPPLCEELSPHKTVILDKRTEIGDTEEIILKVSDEIDRLITNRGKGYPKRMKKPSRSSS